MANLFDIGHVAQLHEIQSARLRRGEPGIGPEIEELIRRLTSGGVAGQSDDARLVQAKRYWDLGVGRELGKESFEDYLKDIPEIPDKMRAHDQFFPYLVLVEPRIGLECLCDLAGIYRERKITPNDVLRSNPILPCWVRIQDGRKNRDRSVQECRKNFVKYERGLTALQGVCAYLQHPGVITAVENGAESHVMIMPGSFFDVSNGYYVCVCLELKGGQAKLIFSGRGRIEGYPDAGTASCRLS